MSEKPRHTPINGHAIEARIVRLAVRQHGNVTRRQLLAVGLSAEAIQRRIETGRIHRVHNGVYAVGRPATTALERAAAAVLASGDRALLSHLPALALWGLRQRWPSQMEITTPAHRRHPGIRIHRCRALSRRDVRRRHGIAVTSPARTLLDCAPQLSRRALTRAVNDALRAKLLRPGELAELAQRGGRRPGIARLRAFVEKATGPTRSDMEDVFVEVCARFALPAPAINATVDGYEVDAYFAAERLIVELDSWTFHSDRDAFENDRERDAHALSHGNATVRVTWERLKGQPEAEARRLQGILNARRPSAS